VLLSINAGAHPVGADAKSALFVLCMIDPNSVDDKSLSNARKSLYANK
jgi:hypothetical protein